ncbi:MAG: hypothetical protein PHE68_04790 [Candidatus Peribacteraceae bacterium]|nr:hypothetical protein [Candidatus Peribacteraceae bacterium]MDD5074707.1 hypothetical protein [Candidatus Peribacteraceae bacterium]
MSGAGLFFFGFAGKALAVCPVCTVAVAAGVGIAEELGIDDAITGLWVGGLTVSVTLWTVVWFEKKNIHFFLRDFWMALGYYMLVVLPLPYLFKDVIGSPKHMLWGVDKLLLGTGIGSVAFFLGADWYRRIKARRGHAYFPFQKVVMPVAPLLILSFIFYYITY